VATPEMGMTFVSVGVQRGEKFHASLFDWETEPQFVAVTTRPRARRVSEGAVWSGFGHAVEAGSAVRPAHTRGHVQYAAPLRAPRRVKSPQTLAALPCLCLG